MFETALFQLFEVQLQFLEVGAFLDIVVYVLDFQFFMRINNSHVTVFEIDHLAGVLHDGGAVGADEVLVVADADEQGAALLGEDDLVGFVGTDDGEGIGAHHIGKGDADGFGEVALLVLVDVVNEVYQHLRVGFAAEDVSALCQLLAESQVVFDDAVMDDGDAAVGGEVRVGVGAARFAVGGPARVPDARVPRNVLRHAEFVQLVHAAPLFEGGKSAILDDGNTSAVVTAVFQSFKSLYQNGVRFFAPRVCYNAAHIIFRFKVNGL